MSKIGLIIEREYLSRVTKKSFLILTFLTPLLLVGMTMVPLLLAQIKSDDIRRIAVVDQTGLYTHSLADFDNYRFIPLEGEPEALKKEKSLYAMVVISGKLASTPNPVTIYSEKQITIELKNYITRELEQIAREEKLATYGIDNLKQIIDDARVRLSIATIKLREDGNEREGSSEMVMIVGLISTLMIFMFIYLYGAQVMQGVMQEKSNRIVEIMISSVRPFELMMGKIVGIALVGLTQFLLWIILSGGILLWIGLLFNLDLSGQAALSAVQGGENQLQNLVTTFMGINLKQILVLFVVYFIGGYLLYASLFAAVGAAVDSETDTQQFVLPITIPLIFAIYAAMYSAQNPDGPLAFWCSMIPFTSPIVMMVRLPYEVPMWQLALSVAILYATFIATTYLSARIYRIGILMYGKKVTWKEIWKWVKVRN